MNDDKDLAPTERNKVDETLARQAFLGALETYNQDFGTFFLARLLGLEIKYTDETCVIRMDVRDYLYNPQGSLHGGIISLILDVSMGHLLNHQIGPGTTLEMKVQFLRPAHLGPIRCEASFIKRGRSINYLESKLASVDGRLIASATSTWQVLRIAKTGAGLGDGSRPEVALPRSAADQALSQLAPPSSAANSLTSPSPSALVLLGDRSRDWPSPSTSPSPGRRGRTRPTLLAKPSKPFHLVSIRSASSVVSPVPISAAIISPGKTSIARLATPTN